MMLKNRFDQHDRKGIRRMVLTLLMALVMMAFFVFYDALAVWHLIGPLRLVRLLGLVVVAVGLSVATVTFQAVTRNRILSPNVMGFDSVFSLVATGLVFFLTSAVTNQIPIALMFLIQMSLMTFFSVSLFTAILNRKASSIHLLVLVGMVAGQFLKSLTRMMVSIMDPNEYLNVVDTGTASFSVINKDALWITLAVTIVALVLIYRRRHILDILRLGKDLSLNLGLNYDKEIRIALALSCVLVASATALVGPLMFFGLLMANISLLYLDSSKMAYYLPTAAALGVVVLVGGQAILEHVLHQATVLPVVLEFVGGSVLLFLIMKGVRR